VQPANDEGLGHFYDFLYGVREGFVYAASKVPKDNDLVVFKQYFFQWPTQRTDLINFTLSSRSRGDVYMAPALFKERDAHESNVLGSDVVWVELDDPPATVDNVPPPSCRIASGGEGHEHWYWKVDRVLNVEQIRLINTALTYHMDADPSGIDAGQILRPPGTYNFKRKRETSLVEFTGAVIPLDMFSSVPQPPPPPKADVAEVSYIPPVNEVLGKYTFPKTVLDLFNLAMPGHQQRSDALMALGYHCAEMGMAQAEILSMIEDADTRWGKFVGRVDRMQRLIQIVALAIAKYPNRNGAAESLEMVDLTPMGFRTLLHTKVNLEWQWNGLLQKNGYFLLTGPTGVGKTQLSLNAAGKMALGQPFLGREMKPAKIGFFSLEMGITDLKYFLSQLQHTFTLQEQEVLEEQLLFFPLGEPLYMTNDIVKGQMDQLVGDLKLDGIMVDSLGSATDETISDEAFRKFFHWNDKFRQRHDAFTWFIHHHRKANGQNRKPKRIEDVYGTQYITSYATSVVCLWGSEAMPNVLEFITLKKRLGPKDPPFFIQRNERLNYEIVKPGFTSGLGPAPLLPQAEGPPLGTPLGLPGPQTATQGLSGQAPAPQVPPTSFEAIRSGNWSTGPKSFADMNPQTEDIIVNLDMKDSK